MSTVFISGSRHLGRLNQQVRQRLQNMIDGDLHVLIGDANGADKAAQQFFADHQYQSVTVYCMDHTCRNNVGAWPVNSVNGQGKRGFDYYTLKDAQMAMDADCAFMMWDAKSRGTLTNVGRIIDAGKPAVVYFAPTHEFRNIKSRQDLESLLGDCSSEDVKKLASVPREKPQQKSLFAP